MEDIQEGFRVGFDYSKCTCKLAIGNTKSALEHPEVVSDYLAEECSRGRVLGPGSILASRPAGSACQQVWGHSQMQVREVALDSRSVGAKGEER